MESMIPVRENTTLILVMQDLHFDHSMYWSAEAFERILFKLPALLNASRFSFGTVQLSF